MKNNAKNRYERNCVPRIEADINYGLNSEQVSEREKAGLVNKTKRKKGTTYFGIVMSELFTYFNIIYMIITAILIAVGSANQLTYLFVIIPNLIIGIWQKCRSKYNIDKLSLMVKSKVKVKRQGQYQKIDIENIVRDDIICYGLGNQISTDSLLVWGELEVNESMLTGESLPVKKVAGDRLYAGSFVVSGSCEARVYDVGEDNYIEKLSSRAKRYNKPKSEILKYLNIIIKVMSVAIIPLAIFLYLRSPNIVRVAGAMIGMIPSGMFLLTSTALAVSMLRLSKHNTLVQEMYCIEMLARVDTICMDKTGTITDGGMNVQDVLSLDDKLTKDDIAKVVSNMLGCVIDHNATSLALVDYFGVNSEEKCCKYLAFSSDRKYFAVEFDNAAYSLGAPEYVVEYDKYDFVKQVCEREASVGNRVLVLAKVEKGQDLESYQKSEPIGVVVLQDHVREDAISTINYFKENGVDLKVISGDNALTVSEVAKRAGVANADKYISLQDMPIEEVEKIANDYTIFGRVSPQQKEAIIRSIKKNEHTVAMIGDGVNDILALRESDCSVAVGSGTESAKNVSHLILVDDNFSNMKQVIAEGRRCTNNLQCTGSMFLTKTFICLVLCIFSIISGFDYPFNPNQLLLLEFFAIGLPGVFFALQPNTNIIKGRFIDNILSKAFSQGLTAILLCLPLYFLLLDSAYSQTIVFMMISFIVTINSCVVLFRVCRPLNKFRVWVAVSMLLFVLVAFTFGTNLFGLNLLSGTMLDVLGYTQISGAQIGICVGACLLMYPLQELVYYVTIKVINAFKNIKNKTNAQNSSN